jgi:membrane protein involved in D-alanine export
MLWGFHPPENFNHPFFAGNFRELWRRWHISLSEWFADYVFRPLYMSIRRQTAIRLPPLWEQTLCLFFTFALMGLWNGLKLRYLISGLIFGSLTAVHHVYSHFEKRRKRPASSLPAPLRRGAAVALTFACVCFAFYCFSGRMPWISDLEAAHGG